MSDNFNDINSFNEEELEIQLILEKYYNASKKENLNKNNLENNQQVNANIIYENKQIKVQNQNNQSNNDIEFNNIIQNNNLELSHKINFQINQSHFENNNKINSKNNQLLNQICQEQEFNYVNKKNNELMNTNIKQEKHLYKDNNQENKNIIELENNNILTEEEILKAKENGFILIGKTGVGKTSLLNIIFNEEKGKVGYSSSSETKISNYYCMKEKTGLEYIYFCIVDTPGLFDTNGFDADLSQKKDIMKLISNESIKIKGLLFLTNFQNERFDASEQTTLIEYNALFPLKDFWKHIILIFTHYYGDPDGDSKEDIKERASALLSEIFLKIMHKVKKVSEPIQFKDINKKYYNIYSKPNSKKKKESNNIIRKELIFEISNYIKFKPMFSKLQIFNFEKYEIKKDDKFLYDCDLYIYLDANDKIVHQEFKINKKYPRTKEIENKQKIRLNIEESELNKDGALVKKSTIKDSLKEIFENYEGELGKGMTILSLIGAICSNMVFPTIPLAMGGVYLWKKSKDKKEKNKKKIDDIMKKEKIDDLLQSQINNNNKK